MAKVYLQRCREARIENGHPWIYRSEIDRVEGSFQPGEIVDVYWSGGGFVGRGYINPQSQITIRLLTRAEEAGTELFSIVGLSRQLNTGRDSSDRILTHTG